MDCVRNTTGCSGQLAAAGVQLGSPSMESSMAFFAALQLLPRCTETGASFFRKRSLEQATMPQRHKAAPSYERENVPTSLFLPCKQCTVEGFGSNIFRELLHLRSRDRLNRDSRSLEQFIADALRLRSTTRDAFCLAPEGMRGSSRPCQGLLWRSMLSTKDQYSCSEITRASLLHEPVRHFFKEQPEHQQIDRNR